MITYGAAVRKALAAAETLAEQGISAEVIDLRTLVPLDMDTVLESVERTRRAVVLHDAHTFCGPGAELAAQITENLWGDLLAPVLRLGAGYSPIPFADGSGLPPDPRRRRRRGRHAARPLKEIDVGIAIVTGAARGIGRATAVRLIQAGHEVTIVDLDGDAAAATAAEIGAKAVTLDVTDEAAVAEFAADITDLDVLVNNAGLYRPGTLDTQTVEDYRLTFDVNVLGPMLMTRHLANALAAGDGGAVVNVASMSAFVAVPGTGVYSMAKAAVASYTELAALEYAPRGIRVNAVAPGRISTEMTADRQGDPAREARTNALIPLGRSGTPQDVAEAICALASPGAGYITGQVLRVDGGLTIATVPLLQAAQGGH